MADPVHSNLGENWSDYHPHGILGDEEASARQICSMMANQLNTMMRLMNTRLTKIELKMDAQFAELKALISANSSVSSTDGPSDPAAVVSGAEQTDDWEPDFHSHNESSQQQLELSPDCIQSADHVTAIDLSTYTKKGLPRKRRLNSAKVDPQRLAEAIQFKRDNPAVATTEIIRKFNIPGAYKLIQTRFRNGKEHEIAFGWKGNGRKPLLTKREIETLENFILDKQKEGIIVDRPMIDGLVTGLLAQKVPPKGPPSKSFMDHLMMKMRPKIFPRGNTHDQVSAQLSQP